MQGALQCQTRVKACDALTNSDWAAWADMRAGNDALQSPYFSQDYIQQLNKITGDVTILCRYKDARNMAFLALQGKKLMRPAGMPLSDYHGIIQPHDSTLNFNDIFAGTSFGGYHFASAILASPEELPPQQILDCQDTAAFNIENGADIWRSGRDKSYQRHLKSTRRRIRKSSQDIGAPHFVFRAQDTAIFDQLMAWKSEKFRDTGKYNVLDVDWTMALIKTLWQRQGGPELLQCDMHALYFGDYLAAIDLGLTQNGIFHSWIVAYDNQFHSYAPGIQLLEGLIDAAKGLGYHRIDLGAGLDGYKRHYASAGHKVYGGYVPIKGFAGQLTKIYGRAEGLGQKAGKDYLGKLRRRYSQIAACESAPSGRLRAMGAAFKKSPH